MFVLDADQDRSRSRADAVPALLTDLSGVRTVRGFERTAGDEVQGLLDDPVQLVDVVAALGERGGWALGIGVGAVEAPLPESTRAARGPAYLRARAAVESARRSGPGPRLLGPDPVRAERAETALQLLVDLLAGRTEAGREAVAAMVRHDRQADAAAELGISAQAMSRRLAVAGWALEGRTRRLAVHLVAEADVHEPEEER